MTRTRPGPYLSVLAGAICCYAALGAVVRIIPGYVGNSLGYGAFAVGAAIGAPALTAVIARPLGGRLGDQHGTRRVAMAGAAVCAAGALPMFADAFAPFLGSRLLAGVGEGAMMSAAVLWLLRLAGPVRRGQALGHIGLANYAGLTSGPLLTDAIGGASHPGRTFTLAVALPLAALALLGRATPAAAPPAPERGAQPARRLARITAPAGAGLLLVNIGYATLLAFGADAVPGHAGLVLPAYAGTIILVRTLAGSAPDRLGGRLTLGAAAPTAAAGLLLIGLVHVSALALAGVVVLGLGQGLAVPALGLLALGRVAPAQHGAASGLFFAWFDGGVALGGPLAGLAAGIAGSAGALTCAAGAVAAAAPTALWLGRET